jgi:hypothetical protein
LPTHLPHFTQAPFSEPALQVPQSFAFAPLPAAHFPHLTQLSFLPPVPHLLQSTACAPLPACLPHFMQLSFFLPKPQLLHSLAFAPEGAQGLLARDLPFGSSCFREKEKSGRKNKAHMTGNNTNFLIGLII